MVPMSDARPLSTSGEFEAEPSGAGGRFPSLTSTQERRLAWMLNSYFDSTWRAGRSMGLSQAQAEENAQEAFAVAARKLERIEPGCERAFLLGTAVRLAVNARRRVSERLHAAAHADEPSDTADSIPQADELLEQRQERALLDRILASMPDAARQVLTLYEIEELTLPEIAVALEIAEGTAASRLRRAREEFRRRLRRYSAIFARLEEAP
jgi:RNA polymerase sigma-70 factor, ECF subfamily